MKVILIRFVKIACPSLLFFAVALTAYSQDLAHKEIYKRYVDNEFGFSILKPDKWTDITRTDEEGRKYRVFTELKEKEDVFSSNVSIIVSDTIGKTIPEYTKDLLVSYIELFKKFDFEYRDTISINGITFGDFTIKFEMENIEYRMRTVYTIYEETLYHLTAVAPVDRYELDEDNLNDMIMSFMVLE